MNTLSKVVTFQKWKDLCILNKTSGMIPLILCYAPPFVELLGPTKPPVFKPGPTTSPFSKRIDAAVTNIKLYKMTCKNNTN